jgi:hypothetical protein
MSLVDWTQYDGYSTDPPGHVSSSSGKGVVDGEACLTFSESGGEEAWIVNDGSSSSAPAEGEIRTFMRNHVYSGAIFRAIDGSHFYFAVLDASESAVLGYADGRDGNGFIQLTRVARVDAGTISDGYNDNRDTRFVGWENSAGDFSVRIQESSTAGIDGKDTFDRSAPDLTHTDGNRYSAGGGIGLCYSMDANVYYSGFFDLTRVYY